jgi:hypothetical protein
LQFHSQIQEELGITARKKLKKRDLAKRPSGKKIELILKLSQNLSLPLKVMRNLD